MILLIACIWFLIGVWCAETPKLQINDEEPKDLPWSLKLIICAFWPLIGVFALIMHLFGGKKEE